jgi:hypothetical protein
MVISVQPNADEVQQLVADSMALVKEIGNQLSAEVSDDTQPLPPDYWELRAQQSALQVEITIWLNDGVQLALDSAGQAVDAINQSTQGLENALKVTAAIARDVAFVSAFVNLAAAISTGQPQGIVVAGGAFLKLVRAASAPDTATLSSNRRC